MQKIKILIIGTGDLRNYGCEAIIHGTWTILKSLNLDYQLYVASDNIEYDSKVLPPDIKLITYKKRFTVHRIIKGILRRLFHIGNGSAIRMNKNIGKDYDILLSCGGDNFCESPDGGLYHIIQDLMEIGKRAKDAKKSYVLWGASIGPFNKKNKDIVISNLRKCDLICVREKLTFDYLNSTNIRKNLKLVADPAFCMEPDYNIDLKKEKGSIYIGLNLSLLAIDHSISVEERESFVSNLHKTLDLILEKNPLFHYVCIPHVVQDEIPAQNDMLFFQNFLSNTKYRERVSILPKNLGARKTKGYICKMDILIAARMHCCVGGISCGTPTLFVTYSNKGKGMSLYAYGHHKYEIPVKELINNSFSLLVNYMIDERVSIKAYLDKQKERFYNDAIQAGTYLSQIL